VERVWTIVVAAGSGERFGGQKQYALLAGRRVVEWSLDAARSVSDGVVLVVAPELAGQQEAGADIVVAGGSTRSASVRAGLDAIPEDATIVLVHDAARPLASRELFSSVVRAVTDGADAAVPALPIVDTLRRRAGGTVDRDDLVAVQTPQGFRADALREGHSGDDDATDDATLVEAVGGRVVVVDGETDNRKITSASDLADLARLVER
jgi:2-C-methyl-D-erythritol 4-phosphate cytidylyltransferase